MSQRTAEDVAHIVQKALRQARSDHGHEQSIRVLAERIEQKKDQALEHEWWVVPVEVAAVKPHMYRYYEVLDAVEQHLENTESLDVLLVPLTPMEEQAA